MIYITFLFRLLLVVALVAAIINEKKLIKLENKIFLYIKAFFKALFYTVCEVIQKWYIYY
jgi:hypothetical protein